MKYSYDKSKIQQISAWDASNQFCYSHLTFDYPEDNQYDKAISVHTSDGRDILYQFSKKKDYTTDQKNYYLSKVTRPDRPWESFTYNKYNKICRKERPDRRFVEIDYYKKGSNNVGNLCMWELPGKDERIGRVMTLWGPEGPNGEGKIATHRFIYHVNSQGGELLNGTTEVFDSFGQKTTYQYNSDHHLTAVEKFTGNNNQTPAFQFYSSENYVWGSKGSADESNLLGTYLKDCRNRQIHSAKFYDYDRFGNVLTERFYGNLSGKNPAEISLGADGKPLENGCECYCKRFEYTNDERHLLLSESEPNGKTTIYDYKPNTDLLVSKLVLDNGKIIAREFYEYNKIGIVVNKIIDNGSAQTRDNLQGVTERRITKIYPRTTAPVGVPERIDEFYLDLKTDNEILVQRVFSDYFIEGRLKKQDHYDSNGVYQYSLRWDYDKHGNIIEEVNAIGQVIKRKYDDNDNLIYEKGPSSEYETLLSYDCSNRLIHSEEIHNDGTRVTISHFYDFIGNRIKTIDRWGNTTLFFYDEFSRLIRTKGMSVTDENGNLIQPETTTEYDIAGNPIIVRDAKGNATTTTFNARGKPTSITHPDGAVEQFVYNLDGTLQKSIAPNGTQTCYKYDVLGHVVFEEVCNSNNEPLSHTSATYDAFHQLTSTDAEGLVTNYSYDGAGRLIEISFQNRSLRFTYDTLGRIDTKSTQYGPTPNNISVQVFQYDLLNRIKEEQLQDGKKNILQKTKYDYDNFGNRKYIIKDTDAGISTTQFLYNSQNRLIKSTDALGQTTHIIYRYDYYNSLCQRVLQTEIYDPLGNKTITTADALGRTVSIIKRNSFGILLAQQDIFYDAIGNCAKVVDTVVIEGTPTRQLTALWNYNSVGQVTHKTDAVGTPEQKDTHYEYEYGQKSILTKPDGVKIQYTYDPYGLLALMTATDHSVDYSYRYNHNQQVIEIIDNIQHTTTIRTYDPFGAIESETLGNGLTNEYSYDGLGRCKLVNLPDQSQIAYAYDAAHLKEVQRVKDGKLVYVHKYTRFDLAGSNIESTLAGSGGAMEYAYDLTGHVKQITSKEWKQNSAEYDPVGNLLNRTIEDSVGNVSSTYSYDDLYQLKNETGNASHTYVCDSINNRILKNDQPYTINALNQLLEQTDCKYIYDLNGNLLKKDQGQIVTIYNYDALDRLTSVTVNGHAASTYTYDAFNRRLTKNVDNVVTKFIYHDQNEIGAIVDNKITELRLLGIGKGAEIGSAVAIELDQKLYVPIHDHNGNIATLLDAAGDVVETYRYSAFGEEQIYDALGNQIEKSAVGNNWRYSSKRHDPETSFLYFGSRYYAPEIGRWVTPDPIGYDGGPNLYAYVRNNPLILIDLYGLVGEGYRDSCESARRSPHARFKNDSHSTDKYENAMFEDRSNHANNLSSSGYSVNVSLPRHEYFSTEYLLEMYNTDYFESQLTRYPQEYAAGVVTGFSILASEAIIAEVGAAVSGAVSVGISRCINTVAGEISSFVAGRYRAGNYIGTRISNQATTASKSFSRLPCNPLQGTKYSKKVLLQMENNLKTGQPDFHGFPKIVDNYANLGKRDLIIGKDGLTRVKISLEGSYKNLSGNFEWLIEPNNTINHRLFIQTIKKKM